MWALPLKLSYLQVFGVLFFFTTNLFAGAVERGGQPVA